jgi:hypothetical protein
MRVVTGFGYVNSEGLRTSSSGIKSAFLITLRLE